MVFAWSFTEVIRYSYYACNLLGYEPSVLLYIRYTTFYVLYPLGASSEAFLMYATLPPTSPIPSWQSWVFGMWKPADYIRGLLFLIWWPSQCLSPILSYQQLTSCRSLHALYSHDETKA